MTQAAETEIEPWDGPAEEDTPRRSALREVPLSGRLQQKGQRVTLYSEAHVILHQIASCADESELYQVCDKKRHRFEPRHFAAAFTRVGELFGGRMQREGAEKRRNVQSLLEWLAKEAIFSMASFDAKDVAAVTAGVARVEYVHPSLLCSLDFRASQVVTRFTPHELAILVEAFAKLRMQPSRKLLSEVSSQLMAVVDILEPSDLVAVMEASGKLTYNGGDNFLRVMVDRAYELLPRLHPHDVVRIVVSARSLGYYPPKAFLERAEGAVHSRLPLCKPQWLCRFLYYLPRAEHVPSARFLQEASRQLCEQLRHVRPVGEAARSYMWAERGLRLVSNMGEEAAGRLEGVSLELAVAQKLEKLPQEAAARIPTAAQKLLAAVEATKQLGRGQNL